MTKKIRTKFILVSSMAVLLMLIIIIGLILVVSDYSLKSKTYNELEYILDNDGIMPDYKENHSKEITITPETQYEFRYFSLKTNNDNFEIIDMNHIVSVTDEQAYGMTKKALNNEKGKITENGIIYYYMIKSKSDGEKVIVFLDCTRSVMNMRTLVKFVLLIVCMSFMFFFVLISAFSKRAVRSVIRNIEAQNEFITNAGHELKTPLAIISANTEVLEMVNGKNEWTESTINQVNRMSNLVSDLIFLSKMNEKTNLEFKQINLSKIVRNCADAFIPVIDKEKKRYNFDIEDKIEVGSDEKLLTELINIFIDNSVKYCDDSGNINISLKRKGLGSRQVKLTISNTYADGKNIDYSKFFNRFYREDSSHNSKKSGYGIGLSMAESISKKIKAKINVNYADETIYFNILF